MSIQTRTISKVSFLLCCLFSLCLAATAQSTFGTLLGTVKDASGSVIPNATVKITNVDENTVRNVQANSNGDYEAVNMKPGRYKVEVSASGFQNFTTSEVMLAARQTLRVDATLGTGQVNVQVDVTANAGAIATETQTISSSFESQKIMNLPANYRGAGGSTSPYALIAALPGVQSDNGGAFSIQGALPSQSQFSLDGISTTNVTGNSPLRNAFPSAESIAEIKVQGVGNAAEYGQVGDVTTISKSGTNDYHATAFWFHQNRALDAKAYGALTKPQKISNDFGGSGGGPVRLPWLYNGKDRTFFFGTFEALRLPRGQTIQNTVPTQALRNGDFSGLANVTVRDPLTGQPFANNRIPDNRISPIAKAILTLYPLPNVTNPDQFRVANYIRNASNNINSDQFDIRVDHNLTSKQSVFSRYTWKEVSTDSPNSLSLPSNTAFDNYKILVASHNYAITPRLLNEARFGLTLNDSGTAFPFDGRDFTNKLGFTGIGPNFPFNGLPNIDFSGDITDLNRNRADGASQSRTFQFNNNLTWTKGRHTTKYGFDVRWIRAVSPLGFIGADNYGNSSFNNTFSGNDFGDFLLGIPIRTSYAIIQQDNDGRTTHYHFFGQDSFRVSQKLTLEFGLRYEYHPGYTDAGGNIGNFDPSVPRTGRVVYPTGKRNLLAPGFLSTFNACPAPAANGAACTPVLSAEEAGLPEGLRTVPLNRLLPRFGFAFRPFGDDKTVVRGGIGAYNGTLLGSIYFSLTGTLQSDVREFTNLNQQGRPLYQWPQIQSGGTGISTGQLGTASFRTANDINYKDPYSVQWNLSVDRYVGFGVGVRVSYIGMKTTQLAWAPDLNQMTNSTQFAINRPLSDRPFPNWGIIFTRTAGATAYYNAMQVEANRRFANGLTFNSTYTWAKSLADNLGPNATGFIGETGGGRAADLYNRQAEYGDDYATRRHRSISTLVYDLPVGKGRRFASGIHPAANAVIGGWQMSAIFLAQTGPFLTPFLGSNVVDPSGSGSGLSRNQHPDRIGNGNISNKTQDQWFDVNAFVCPGLTTRVAANCRIGINPTRDAAPIGRFGNAGVGIITGPGTINLSLGLNKAFYLTERIKLEAGASFTNVENRVNLADPQMNVISTAFGRITSARSSELGGSRTGQVTMRLSF
ncbi:MAG TPA: TonB-dependent receptor [Blastocatellia bacterium]|nr:TonB-dependent receptor [Blastocatellia bacterium]HMX26261.1 TonB-dependent receptor [Blastocatellia bacterium]HMY71237.1 TonB-dependent receptor [Blastocatellia bacterium]HMZ18192.1 TonB-dependent receptor [Blastocatellia bacterium]HNG32910.1 TonB-dependent receptor [Blastocatellia bacterium]